MVVSKGKLKMALAAEKGTDFKVIRLKRRRKQAQSQNKKTASPAAPASDAQPEKHEDEDKDEDEVEDEEEDYDEDDDDEGGVEISGRSSHFSVGLDAIDDTDSSTSSVEIEPRATRTPRGRKPVVGAIPDPSDHLSDGQSDGESASDIALSDLDELSDEDREDVIPHTRLTINNAAALTATLARIALPAAGPFATRMAVTAATTTADAAPDSTDDLRRELAFYAQGLDAARRARAALRAEAVPFARPPDFFAEMVKQDGHMDRVRARLVDDAAARRAAVDARRQRDLRKFGKQVQIAKLQERHKEKRDTLDKIKLLKRKRKDSSGAGLAAREADEFDVAVADELGEKAPRDRDSGAAKRRRKDEKYGFGGRKRFAKSGDALSSGDVSGMFGAGGRRPGKGTGGHKSAQRLGKSRRKTGQTAKR